MSERDSAKGSAEARRDLAGHPARRGHTDAVRRFLGAALYPQTRTGNKNTDGTSQEHGTHPAESTEVAPPAPGDETTEQG